MKRIFGLLGLVVVALVAIVLVRTMMFTPAQVKTEEAVAFEVDAAKVAQHLSEAVRFQTISPLAPARRDDAPFDEFLTWAKKTYPELHALETQIIERHTLLIKWPGKNPDLKPVMLAAHYDVVPVVPGTEQSWTHPPFAGTIADDYVWGRGALDDKSGVIVMMEAATLLMAQGFEPSRTVYFAFDHDEEIGGNEGAAGVTSFLADQGIQLAWSIDEGSFILENIREGLTLPMASINVAEKGYLSLQLVAHGDSGHSSMPSRDASIFLLAEAISRLRDNPLEGGLNGISLQALDTMARHSSFAERALFANRWLFKGVIENILSKSATTNSWLRTTTAPTLLSAGIKDNVLPGTATATVNFRLDPRDTTDEVIEAVRAIVDDERIVISPLDGGLGSEASNISSTEGLGFQTIAKVSRQIFGPVIVVPGVTSGGTNSKHYEKVADDAYRINLMRLGPEDIAGFHGTNERISVDNLATGTAAYAQLITLGAGE